jgi:hypothetical protein
MKCNCFEEFGKYIDFVSGNELNVSELNVSEARFSEQLRALPFLLMIKRPAQPL